MKFETVRALDARTTVVRFVFKGEEYDMPRGTRKTTTTGDGRIADGKAIGQVLAKYGEADRGLVLELAGEWVKARDGAKEAAAVAKKPRAVAPKPPAKPATPTKPPMARAIGATPDED